MTALPGSPVRLKADTTIVLKADTTIVSVVSEAGECDRT